MRFLFLILFLVLAGGYILVRPLLPLMRSPIQGLHRLSEKVGVWVRRWIRFLRTPLHEMPDKVISKLILKIQAHQEQALKALLVLFCVVLKGKGTLLAFSPRWIRGQRSPSILFMTEGTAKKGQAPASRFRVYQYLPYLKESAIRYKVCWSKPGKYFHVTARYHRFAKKYPRLAQLWYLAGNLWMTYNRMFESFFGALKYDACFIQRELVPNPNMFVEMFVLGCFNKVFFDFDDSIFLYPSWAKAQKGTLENKEMERKIYYLISRSSEVIVSNAFLQEKVATLNPHVSVIPTPLDTTYYKPVKKNTHGRPVLIGWTGTSGNLYYLKQIMDVFEKLWEEGANFKLRIICNIPEQDYGIDMTKGYMEFREWTLRDEIKNFDEIDIGIMPLTDDDWTRGKAGFKILQFMASGIPIVASPVGVNSEIVIHRENGFLARTEEEWVRFLKKLIEDRDLRERMGKKGRGHIENHYSLKVIAPRFLGILQRQLRPS